MNRILLRDIQTRTARVAVSASAARGQGKGVVSAARGFLSTVGLRSFAVGDAARFGKVLDQVTLAMQAQLPRGSRHWGTARKLLNIYLRDCLYNTYLNAAYQLGTAECLYEIPLDSIVAKRMRSTPDGRDLPRWLGVKYVTRELSDLYQGKAEAIAQRQGIARIHLDAKWWGADRNTRS